MNKRILLFTPTAFRIIVLLSVLFAFVFAYSIVGAQQDYLVGEKASELGVRKYRVEDNKVNTIVYFNHAEKERSGKLVIHPDTTDGSVLLDLSQENGQRISIIWSPHSGEFTIKDSTYQAAHFLFVEKEWVADNDEEAKKLLDAYSENVKLAGAIFVDFDSSNENQNDSQVATQYVETPCAERQNPLSVPCPCYEILVRGSCFRTLRSEACRCATNDANTKCTNQYCWGCCDFVWTDCDCACIIEDYFCACGRGAWACHGYCWG